MDVGTLQEFEGIFLTPAELKELKAFGRNQTLPHGNSKTLLDYGLVANNFGASFSDGDSIGNPGCHITPKGERYLEYLKETRKKVADDNAKQESEKRHKAIQAEKDKKQQFRHDFFVAAFTFALTLLLEHAAEIANFVLEFINSFSQRTA